MSSALFFECLILFTYNFMNFTLITRTTCRSINTKSQIILKCIFYVPNYFECGNCF